MKVTLGHHRIVIHKSLLIVAKTMTANGQSIAIQRRENVKAFAKGISSFVEKMHIVLRSVICHTVLAHPGGNYVGDAYDTDGVGCQLQSER